MKKTFPVKYNSKLGFTTTNSPKCVVNLDMKSLVSREFMMVTIKAICKWLLMKINNKKSIKIFSLSNKKLKKFIKLSLTPKCSLPQIKINQLIKEKHLNSTLHWKRNLMFLMKFLWTLTKNKLKMIKLEKFHKLWHSGQ